MIGQSHLIEMRMRRKAPRWIEVETTAGMDAWAKHWPTKGPESCHVYIDPTENLQRLDLRCFCGLEVKVVGEDQRRVREVFDAIRDEAAGRVIGTVLERKPWGFETVEMLDTEGLMTWHR